MPMISAANAPLVKYSAAYFKGREHAERRCCGAPTILARRNLLAFVRGMSLLAWFC